MKSVIIFPAMLAALVLALTTGIDHAMQTWTATLIVIKIQEIRQRSFYPLDFLFADRIVANTNVL